MANYIEITISVSSQEQSDLLIAALSNAGASGFTEEKKTLTAYFPETQFDKKIIAEIIEQNTANYSVSTVEDRNWNAEWEQGFQPVRVEDFCGIRAAFHTALTGVAHEIVITPKMSFGTGHHATTFLMIRAMRQLAMLDKTVFDFGTGTGVLAILASRLGAKSITAIDNDEWSISNAAENFITNNCHNILLAKSEDIIGCPHFDIMLANINRNVILQQLPSLQQHLAVNGVVVLSGLLEGDRAEILARASSAGLALKTEEQMDGWICLQLVNS